MRVRTLVGLVLVLLLASACQEAAPDLEALFPAQVGGYLRISGPAPDPETGVDEATYQGPQGAMVLRVTRIGREAIGDALAGLPPGASEIGHDPALGMRSGVTFTYAGSAHAAWGNGDWLFVVDAPDRETLATFLAAYGF
jgi:hypothetical protein